MLNNPPFYHRGVPYHLKKTTDDEKWYGILCDKDGNPEYHTDFCDNRREAEMLVLALISAKKGG